VNHLRYFREKRIVSLEAHRDDARSIHGVDDDARALDDARSRTRAHLYLRHRHRLSSSSRTARRRVSSRARRFVRFSHLFARLAKARALTPPSRRVGARARAVGLAKICVRGLGRFRIASARRRRRARAIVATG
jgi:hypothetical protein